MKKILLILIPAWLGFTLGILFMMPGNISNEYFELTNDFCLQEVGILKKGTKVKFDQSFPEGFSRFTLSVNVPGNISLTQFQTEHKDLTIPYWLGEIGSDCVGDSK